MYLNPEKKNIFLIFFDLIFWNDFGYNGEKIEIRTFKV